MTVPFVAPFRRTGVYLDHNATAPLKPEVRAAMGQAMDLVGNPSSVHAFGRSARRAVEERYQGATVKRFRTAGHYPYVTRPEEYNAIIRERLKAAG